MLSSQPRGNASDRSWRTHLDSGASSEHAGLSDQALDAYTRSLNAAASQSERAESLIRIARVHRTCSRWEQSLALARDAEKIATAAGAFDLAAEAINVEAGAQLMRGLLDDAAALIDRALPMVQSPRVRGITLQNKAVIAGRGGDRTAARALWDESIAAFRQASYEIGIAVSLINAAVLAQESGELRRALDLNNQAITLARSIIAHDLMLSAVQNQAHVMVKLGWFDKAQTMLTESFGYFTTAGNTLRQAECLEIIGELNSMQTGDIQTARRSLELARSLAAKVEDRALIDRIDAKLKKLQPPKGGE